MKQRKNSVFKRIRDIQENSEYTVTERSFVRIGLGGAIMSYALSLYYLISGGERIYNGLLILASAVALSIFYAIGIKTLKLKLAAIISSIWVTFILFPGTFFLGGGFDSGAATWFLMGFAYVTLVLTGKLRGIFFIIQVAIFSLCFGISHLYPDFGIKLNSFQMAIDSIIAVVMVGSGVTLMFFFREHIMISEQEIVQDQKKEIERLTKSQQGFFTRMSRKIRTPIGGITGLNEMVLRSENITEEISENTKNIVSASDMLLTIIEDIMDMNKMQIGDISIENSEYDAAVLFREIKNMLTPKAAGKGLELTFDIDPDFPVNLFSDRIRLKQIFVNIVNNAVKYTREGSVKFSARAENVGGSLIKTIYTVEDTGIGIKEENIGSLFSSFSRIDMAVNRSIEGTGLGLSIVKGLLDAMGGQVDVKSTYGKGSTFTITIPQNRIGEEKIGDLDSYKEKTSVKEKAGFTLKGGKILIVDDDRMSREVVKKLLLNTGADIDLCDSGRKALSMADKTKYHIILMDHVMPEMDGVEAFHRIRTGQNSKNRMTPIVALTANAGENLKDVYQNIGFAGYLSKPVNVSLLEEFVLKSMPEEIIEFESDAAHDKAVSNEELKKKFPVLITTDSMCGALPEDLDRLGVAVLPYCIAMPDGSAFVEGDEIDVDSLRAIQLGQGIAAEVVNTDLAEEFFRTQLEKAENILHLCIFVSDVSNNYDRLCRVADKVGHVTVFESGTASVGAGIMTVYAAKLASEGHQMLYIIDALIELKKRIEFRTRIGEVGLLVAQGRFPKGMGRILQGLRLNPLIKTQDSDLKLYGFISEKASMEKYLERVLNERFEYEDEIYIAHPDVRNSMEELTKLKVLAEKHGIKNVVIVQSSPIMVANSGYNSLAVGMVRKHE